MKLQELIDFEEQLLTFEDKHKFDVDFNDYVLLNECLNKIGKITTTYFFLIEEFDLTLNKSGITKKEYEKILTEYNDKLLNSEVNCEIQNGLNIIQKYA